MNKIIEWINGFSIGGKLSLLWFVIITLLVLYGTMKLVKYAEIIITKTKFGSAFVGGVLIATITSIPELITEITQSFSGHPGIGIADDIGSNAFSAFLIGVASIIFLKKMFFQKLGRWSQISIFISFAISIIMTLTMYFAKDINIGVPNKFIIGIIPMSMFIIYLITLILQYKFGDSDEKDKVLKIPRISVKRAIFLFIFWGLFLIFFSLVLNWVSSSIQDGYGLNSRSIGGIFLSIATSMPEVVAFFLLVKRNKPVMGIASLIGSHIFNIGISFFGDMAYTEQASFTNIGVQANWPLALITTIMMGLLFVQVLLQKYTRIINKKQFYIIIPLLVSITYIVGWVCILTI